ncbi:MAG: maleylpyruvate isomerase N-terminal domain-containing protein [Microthrixaceae bacterium]
MTSSGGDSGSSANGDAEESDLDAFDGTTQYRDTRVRLVELGRSLTEAQGRLMVSATPEWSIKDAYSHLAGAASDMLAGNLEGVTTDPWTEAQVAARRNRDLAEVVDELASLCEAMDSTIDSVGDAMDIRLFIDQWTHEQDIRGTVGIAGGADSPIVAKASPGMAKGWVNGAARAGLPVLEVAMDGTTYAPRGSSGDAQVTLSVDGYEAMRVGLGRRSRAQLEKLDWSGISDPGDYFDHLVFFTIADRDVIDSR